MSAISRLEHCLPNAVKADLKSTGDTLRVGSLFKDVEEN
tara:strand:+ start:478 stop:594 length:117 start_codon:yes stop_codon:yes gene_type:complete